MYGSQLGPCARAISSVARGPDTLPPRMTIPLVSDVVHSRAELDVMTPAEGAARNDHEQENRHTHGQEDKLLIDAFTTIHGVGAHAPFLVGVTRDVASRHAAPIIVAHVVRAHRAGGADPVGVVAAPIATILDVGLKTAPALLARKVACSPHAHA